MRRNEGTVHFIPYHAWEERSDWSESDSSIQPLLSSDWSNLIAVSSQCLPVGGASLANDAGRSECGVNKCGEALRSTSRSALRCMPLCVCFYFYSTVVIVHTLALIFFFFFFFIYIYILLYFNIYLLNERRRPRKH